MDSLSFDEFQPALSVYDRAHDPVYRLAALGDSRAMLGLKA
jgi:hypothetical protein